MSTQCDQNVKAGITDLPEEILEQILSLLCPYRDYKSAMLVCKLWHQIMNGVHVQEAARFRRALATGGVEWSSKQPEYGTTITDRFLHSAVYYDKSIYVFGGCTATSTTFNDLWRFDLSLRQWIRPLATGIYPSPKACSSLVEYNGMLILFGGFSHPTPYPLHQPARFFNQLHTHCPVSNRWSHVVSVTGAQGEVYPPGIAGHSATVVRNTMVVIGGSHNQGHSCIDIWELNLEDMTWKLRNVSGVKPLPRYGHSQALIDDNHLLIMGGCGGPNMQFNDLWLLNMDSDVWSWKEMTILGTLHSPPQLWYHPSCKVGDNIVVLSKLSAKSPRAADPPATTLQNIKLSKLWVPPRAAAKPPPSADNSKHGPKRRLPETSESSSQDSSSDSEDTLGAWRSLASGATVASNQQGKPLNSSNASMPSPSAEAVGMATNSSAGVGAAVNTSPPISGAPRPGMPSVRPNAMRNRQKQLETLKRYEDRIKRQMRQEKDGLGQARQQQPGGAAASSDESDSEFVPTCMQQQRTNHPMYVHVLDISKAVADGTVEWLPVTRKHSGEAPEETILYSLVHGRGEIIMFGGIQTDGNTMQMGMNIPPKVVSNNLHFIKAQYHFR